MKTSHVIICAWLVLLPLAGAAQQIETFLAGEETSHRMALGPDTALWLCLGDPARLIKVDQSGSQEVPFAGHIWLPYNWGADVYADPLGNLWLVQGSAPDGSGGRRRIFHFDEASGLSYSGLSIPRCDGCSDLFFDIDGNLYCAVWYGQPEPEWSELVELTPDGTITRFRAHRGVIETALIVSPQDAWLGVSGDGLYHVNLITQRVIEHISQEAIGGEAARPVALDKLGVLWVLSDERILRYDGEAVDVFAADGPYMCLAVEADGTVWASSLEGLVRFGVDKTALLTAEDGILNPRIEQIVVDYQGNKWLRHPDGLSCISDGGLASQRITLARATAGSRLAVIASAENSGKPVVADAYVALELGGKLLFWPHWTQITESYPALLFPGFNFSCTVVEVETGLLAPGTYRFYGALTLPDSSSFIGRIAVLELKIK